MPDRKVWTLPARFWKPHLRSPRSWVLTPRRVGSTTGGINLETSPLPLDIEVAPSVTTICGQFGGPIKNFIVTFFSLNLGVVRHAKDRAISCSSGSARFDLSTTVKVGSFSGGKQWTTPVSILAENSGADGRLPLAE